MPEFSHGDVSIHYEVRGSGYPLLLLAPGGLNSTIEMWPRAALDPLTAYADEFQLIAMDQRNAGRSTGPFDVDDPWGAYVSDQLALMDHVGIERFLVMGCCIGCTYALKLAERAPERIRAAVLEQPIGIVDDDRRDYWRGSRREWVGKLVEQRSDLDAETGEAFGARMWAEDFVVSVSREFVSGCPTPLAVLPGVDPIHPAEVAAEIGTLAPHALVIDPWKDPDHIVEATGDIRAFLEDHAS